MSPAVTFSGKSLHYRISSTLEERKKTMRSCAGICDIFLMIPCLPIFPPGQLPDDMISNFQLDVGIHTTQHI